MAYYQFDLTVKGYAPGTTGGAVRYIVETGEAGQTYPVAVDSGSGNLSLTVWTGDDQVDLTGNEQIWFVIMSFDTPLTAHDIKVIGPYIVSDIGTIV